MSNKEIEIRENLYDKVLTYLVEQEECSTDEANYVMTYFIEQGMNPTDVFVRGLGNMLFGKNKQTQVQGNLFTKKGKPQNFRGGRQPFTSTDPIKQGPRSPLSPSVRGPGSSFGQMRIPGLSQRMQNMRNITRNPSAGLPGTPGGISMSGTTTPTGTRAPRPQWGTGAAKPTPSTPKPSLRPGGQTPRPQFPSPTKAVKPTPTSKITSNTYRPGATVRATGPNLDKFPGLNRFNNRPSSLPSAGSAISTAAQLSRLGTPAGVAAAVFKPTPTGDGTLASAKARGDYDGALPSVTTSSANKYNTMDPDGKIRSRLKVGPAKVGPAKVGPAKVGPAKVGTVSQNFDRAFADARKSGKTEFTWRGKKYNTKLK
jgi:hypothetical protein